ncbi:MAG: exonuclease domain-containing protein [Weeksellaceae bacterium]|nr:exonuclease domain-containing protein [Weeksellaceae bacterium]
MYAVLDIEATGGQMGEEEIIEIAVYRFDGRMTTDQLISLVKPDRNIDPYVQKLTRITPKTVSTAPRFHEIAKRIIEITVDAVLVGHNVDFDYRMLRQEFRKLGYIYQRDTIDTVQLSEKYFPNTTSHSLGKLCNELGIPTTDRHRASGDARATLELFRLMLEKDSEKNITQYNSANGKAQLSEFGYKGLPNAAGVFYIRDKKRKVIYLAAADNIAQNARRLLNGKTEISRKIKTQFDSIHFELTGNQLISKIKELNELRELKPVFNRVEPNFTHSICLESRMDYQVLVIRKSEKNRDNSVLEFQYPRRIREVLSHITSEFELCPMLNRLVPMDNECFSYEVGECRGACKGIESSETYNQRIQLFLDKINIENKNFLIVGNGRKMSEKSFVLIENGICKGYGYFEFHNQIKDTKTIAERMTAVSPDPDCIKIIKPFLATGRYRDIISLDS